jgi:hypothetical protein
MKYILVILFCCIYTIQISSHGTAMDMSSYILSRTPAYTYKQMFVESSFRKHIISKKGAVGTMQVMPQTATELMRQKISADILKDSTFCLLTGILYMTHLRRFWEKLGYSGKQLEQVTLMSYNGGPGYAIHRHFPKPTAKHICMMYWHYDNHNTIPIIQKHLPNPKPTKYVKLILED